MERVAVIYDSDCAFCNHSVSLLRKWDSKRTLYFVPCKSEERQKEFPEVSLETCMGAMQVILPGKHRESGFDGFISIMVYIGGWKKALALTMYYLPGAKFLGRKMYGWIAKNRYKIRCNDDHCHL